MQQRELPRAKLVGIAVAGDEKRVGVQRAPAHGDLAGALDAAAAQQRFHAQQKLFKIHGLCEVVVRPGVEAGAHIVKGVLYRYHQHRRCVARFTQLADEPAAVKPGHHHVGDDEMHAVVLEKIERRLTVGGLRNLISGAAEVNADQPPQPGVVFNDENVRHALPCLSEEMSIQL